MRYFSSVPHTFTFSNKVHDKDDIVAFPYSELQEATNNFSTKMLLGKGSHVRVYKAVFGGRKLIAAVKKSKHCKQKLSSTINPIENEMKILSNIKNHLLVNLIGYSVDPSGDPLTVFQYMPNGTLNDHLHDIRKRRSLSWRKRVKIALDVAEAIDTLHSANPPVIHRDIKSSNVLLDKNFNALVGDFSLALRGHVEDVSLQSIPPAGTLGYIDPSYVRPGDLSLKTDVFSFGILLLEIISGRNAIDVNYSPCLITEWVFPLIKECDFASICDRRIGFPTDESVVRKLVVLASDCVAEDGERRPEICDVVKVLKEVRVKSWIDNFTRCLRTSL